MGDHRSGTTFLYSLLQATGAFNVVTAYHVLCYPTLLANHFASRTECAHREVAEAMRKAGIGDRGIDAVKATPDTPEEYAFILGREHASAWLPKPHANAATLPLFQELCRKVQFMGDVRKPLLLKNPHDYENVPFLKDRFPSAKFLYLHRHPAKTVDSQLRAARLLFNARNPYVAMLSPSYDRLFQCPKVLAFYRTVTSPRHGLASRILVGGAIRRIRNATQQRIALSASDRFDVRYEDLCCTPNECIYAIISWLQLESGGDDLSTKAAPRERPLLGEVERLSARLAKRLQDYYAEFGYSTMPSK